MVARRQLSLERRFIQQGERLFRSDKAAYERFVAFTGPDARTFLTWHQSAMDPPNAYLRTLGAPVDTAPAGEAKYRTSSVAVTHLADPSPEVRAIHKRLVKYKRADGLDLSALISEVARAAERARSSAMALLDEAGRCEGAARQQASGVPSVAEAEERLSAAESELASLRDTQRTLALTRDFLARAQQRIHRDIAPVLARTLTERLPEVTSGRYVDALVDPASLQV